MDDTEAHALKHLASLGLGTPVFEPDGNVPPDFLLPGGIAVEVRRLNQNDTSTGQRRGLEETAIPLRRKVDDLLATLGPPREDGSWFIMYRFRRPLEDWATLRPQLRQWLTDFARKPEPRTVEHTFESGFEVTLTRAGAPLQHMFQLGGYSDRDTWAFLVPAMQKNIEICIAEKAEKVAPRRALYPRWWLLLVDRIGYGLSDLDREQLHAAVGVDHTWERVIILSALDHLRAFDL